MRSVVKCHMNGRTCSHMYLHVSTHSENHEIINEYKASLYKRRSRLLKKLSQQVSRSAVLFT